jgi:hypothetical protein
MVVPSDVAHLVMQVAPGGGPRNCDKIYDGNETGRLPANSLITASAA